MVKKIIKYIFLNLILYCLVYSISLGTVNGGIHLVLLFRPYEYMTLSQVNVVKTIAFASVVISIVMSLITSYARKKEADIALVILSICIPVLGLILGVIYRVRQEKNIDISNVFLLASISSIFVIIIITIYYFLFMF